MRNSFELELNCPHCQQPFTCLEPGQYVLRCGATVNIELNPIVYLIEVPNVPHDTHVGQQRLT